MEIDNDKELFESALTDDAPQPEAEAPAEQPAAEDQGQPRDASGRFAARHEPEPQPEPAPAPQAQQPVRDEANVPSWRLREVREEGERRLAEERANWQRQIEMLQRQNQPPPVPAPEIDPFQDPAAFRDQGIEQRINPLKGEVQATRDFYSHRDAVREHGKEKVSAAFQALDQAARNGNREAQDLCARVHSGLMDPWGEIVSWHQKATVYQQIGNDPNAWARDKWLKEQLADPKAAGEILQMIQQSVRGQPAPQGKPNISLPPSLNRVAAAQGVLGDDGGDDDASMYAHATR